MKNLFITTIITLASVASMAYVSEVTMNCDSAKAKDGTPLVGVGYQLVINHGFDTHAPNGHGGFGQSFMIADLISKVVSPTAEPQIERLVLQRKKATGYYFADDKVAASVNKSLSAARVLFSDSKATAECKAN